MFPATKTVDELHDALIASFEENPFFPEPVNESWTDILMYVPEMRKRKLYEDITDIVADAMTTSDLNKLASTAILCDLRTYFFAIADVRQLGFPHMNDYEADWSAIAGRKLSDRFNGSKPASKNKRAQLPEKVHHSWLQ